MPRFLYKLCVLFFGALSLSACATVDYEAFNAKLDSGESSAIVSQFDNTDTGMWGATLQLHNVTEGMIYTRTFDGYGPSVAEVKPGKYRIRSGSTYGYNVTGSLPLIEFWFEDFQVGPGEIVDIGKFGYKTFSVKSEASSAKKVWNALNSLGTEVNDTADYVTYTVSALDQDEVQEALEKNFAANKSKLVSRPLVRVLSEEEFRKVIDEASAPDADGNLPPTEVSRERIGKALAALLLESMAEDES